MEEWGAERSEDKILLEEVSWLFGEHGSRAAVLEVCGYESGKAGRAHSLVEKECVEVKALFCVKDGVVE